MKKIYHRTNTKFKETERLIERLEELTTGAYATNSAFDVVNIMKNKPKAYRIIYDSNINYYFIGDAFNYIHIDLLEEAYKQGFYPDKFAVDEMRDYMDDEMYNDNLLLFSFYPNEGKKLDIEKSSDGYTRKYVYDFGNIYAHEMTPLEHSDIYSILGKPLKREDIFEDKINFKKLNKLIENYLCEEAARIGNEIEVRNDGVEDKFAHFHWLQNYDIHFEFSQTCPTNVEQLKKLISPIDKNKHISNKELSRLLRAIRAKVAKGKFKGKTVYEVALLRWKELNPDTPVKFVKI